MPSPEFAKLIEESNVRNVMCMFTELRGILQSFTIPAREFLEGNACEGVGFDGSSVRGFKSIEMSDMVWVPDQSSIRVVPWMEDPVQKSAMVFGDIYEAFGEKGGGKISDVDPRSDSHSA